jgi:hypothetical protein
MVNNNDLFIMLQIYPAACRGWGVYFQQREIIVNNVISTVGRNLPSISRFLIRASLEMTMLCERRLYNFSLNRCIADINKYVTVQ